MSLDSLNDLPSNSRKSKQQATPKKEIVEIVEEKKVVEKVISGGVSKKKPSLWSKFKEVFAGDDAKTVGVYILTDVMVPSIKDFLYTAVTQGVERSLWGDSVMPAHRRGPTPRGGYVSYDKVGKSPRTAQSGLRAVDQKQSVDDLVFDNRVDAQLVLDQLLQIADMYETASVNDLNDSIGKSGDFTDNKWGWDLQELNRARIERVAGGGYRLRLPRAVPIA